MIHSNAIKKCFSYLFLNKYKVIDQSQVEVTNMNHDV